MTREEFAAKVSDRFKAMSEKPEDVFPQLSWGKIWVIIAGLARLVEDKGLSEGQKEDAQDLINQFLALAAQNDKPMKVLLEQWKG